MAAARKYISIFPDYPISILKIEELERYRKKVLHAQVEGPSLIRVLNGPSQILRTVDGHHVNKSFIVGVRDYVDPHERRSAMAEYERRNQISLYVSLELSTLEEIAGIINVRKIAEDVEVCMERALSPSSTDIFIGMRTDWNSTEKLDALIDPGILDVFERARLSHSYMAVNRNLIKGYVLVRVMENGPTEKAEGKK